MIVQSIDGSSAGGNALLDLLKVVANPEQYAAQVAELQAKIDESNALIALAGKASEIVGMREGLAAERDGALRDIEKLRLGGAAVRADAEAAALKVVADAKAEADDIKAASKKLDAASKAKQKAADAAQAAADAAQAAADTAQADAVAAQATAAAALDAALLAKADAEALRADLIAKHKAFIESLT